MYVKVFPSVPGNYQYVHMHCALIKVPWGCHLQIITMLQFTDHSLSSTLCQKNLLLDWNHQPPLIQQIWLVVTFLALSKIKSPPWTDEYFRTQKVFIQMWR